MKKLIVIIIFVLSSSAISFAQNKIINIEYEIFFNTEMPNTQKANLYIDKSKNISVYRRNNLKKNEQKSKRNENDNSVSLKFSSKKQGFNYFDFKKDSLFSLENVYGDDYLITEKIPEIKWKLVDEEKIIDNNKVYKATCYFRGRNYVAWYSLDYAFKSGPWKFQGLPGLIFEIYDETKRYNWIIKNISYEDNIDNIFNLDSTEIKNITIKEYAQKKYNSTGLNEKLMSKMPRGTEIVEQDTPRTGFEIKFEWEEKE